MNRFLQNDSENTARILLRRVRQAAAFCLSQLRERAAVRPQRLRILERQALGPRQYLILAEADGRALLIAGSPEASPVFFPLDSASRQEPMAAGSADLSRVAPGAPIPMEPATRASSSYRSARRAQ